MSRVCELTGKRPTTGNLVSHSNIKTRTRWLPNLRRKKFLINETGQTLTLSVSADALRTVDKMGGISNAIVRMKECGLSERLQKVKNSILKSRRAV